VPKTATAMTHQRIPLPAKTFSGRRKFCCATAKKKTWLTGGIRGKREYPCTMPIGAKWK
jgi:hypothetical protein